MEKLKAIAARISDRPAWKKFMRCCRYVARQFEGPRFHRFEVVFMRDGERHTVTLTPRARK